MKIIQIVAVYEPNEVNASIYGLSDEFPSGSVYFWNWYAGEWRLYKAKNPEVDFRIMQDLRGKVGEKK